MPLDNENQDIGRAAADAARAAHAASQPQPEAVAVAVLDYDPDETRVVELLGALASCAGNAPRAVRMLHGRGVEADAGELLVLRDMHSGIYAVLCDEESRAVEEGMAQAYREIASSSQQLAVTILNKLNADADRGVFPRDLDRTLTAAAKSMATATDKLLSITGRPVSGSAGNDPMDALKTLERIGVARLLDRPEDDDVMEAEVVA